jgi:hypothetical protein
VTTGTPIENAVAARKLQDYSPISAELRAVFDHKLQGYRSMTIRS